MRAFLGIPIPDAMCAAFEDAARLIGEGDGHWRDAKWVPRENMHVTVAFLGNVTTEDAHALADDLSARYSALAMPVLRFAGLRAVPGTRQARMIWACFDDPEDLCAKVANDSFDAAARLGVPPSDKEYSAHATLARARKRASLDRAILKKAEDAVRDAMSSGNGLLSEPSATVRVSSVTLFESQLTRTSPVYFPVREIRVGS